MTTPRDIELAVAAGADALGFIFAEESPRRLDPATARKLAARVPPFVSIVGVFVDPTRDELAAARESAPRMILQFNGRESAEFCEQAVDGGALGSYLKVFHVGPEAAGGPDGASDFVELAAYEHGLPMFDSRVGERAGGTGVPFAWELLSRLAGRKIVVSGGLRPGNVGGCVRLLRPYAVDVRSGIETGGAKDEAKMRAFVRAVREADAQA